MSSLLLHHLHHSHGATFEVVNGFEVVRDYGDAALEYRRLRESAALADLSCRGRACLTGEDRVRFLHGQVTNDVAALQVGEGCYAALITAKGRMVSDLNIYRLENELLLDFEPGFSPKVQERLEHYIIADDVQIVDVAPHYGLFSVQGPAARSVLERSRLKLPELYFGIAKTGESVTGEIYVANNLRSGTHGYDIFVPVSQAEAVFSNLLEAATVEGGGLAGWRALETVRIELGVPRFGADMDETNLPPEAGLESRAISYRKGCYIGQEIIARIRTYGQVARSLCGLRLHGEAARLPGRGDKLFSAGKEVGYITSAIVSPALQGNLALGYVHRDANAPGTELTIGAGGEIKATVVALPFQKFA